MITKTPSSAAWLAAMAPIRNALFQRDVAWFELLRRVNEASVSRSSSASQSRLSGATSRDALERRGVPPSPSFLGSTIDAPGRPPPSRS